MPITTKKKIIKYKTQYQIKDNNNKNGKDENSSANKIANENEEVKKKWN